MVVHDEESLQEALQLVDVGSIRYSDEYAYIIITDANTLSERVGSAFSRGDIAIVVPLGQEKTMEVHHAELLKVKDRRRRKEKKMVKEYFREHPERVERIAELAEKRKAKEEE